jgi:hypothetical protein
MPALGLSLCPSASLTPSPCAPPHPHLAPGRELLRDSGVKYAGYKHPHPLDVDIVLKVQSHSSERGTPVEVVSKALGRLVNEMASMRASAKQQIAAIRQREEQIGGGGGGGAM